MYNRKSKCWECEGYEEALLNWCQEPFNRNNPEALYILADHYLSQASKGKQTAEAVYFMERAAKMNHPQAAMAMGQMFQYGWAVQRNTKTAKAWFEHAAKLGDKDAIAFLAQLQRNRRIRALCLGGIGACGVLLLILLTCFPSLLGILPDGIIVHRGTELIEATTTEDFTQVLNELMEDYDTELMLSGEVETNRLLLKFEGSGIDLSDFPAATVLADDDNYLIIQFETEEEAQRCLKALEKMDQVIFVQTDKYHNALGSAGSLSAAAFPTYPSSYTSYAYYSWGAIPMGMDQLAAWAADHQTRPIVAAVLDSGIEPNQSTQDRLIDGADMTNPKTGTALYDDHGHGTHVSGTILECTRGLDVSVLAVKVATADGAVADSHVAEGVKYAIEQDVQVINMSLSFGRCIDALEYYVAEALDAGISVVVAAGNGDIYGNPVDTELICPAHIEGCITVAAIDSDYNIASFSNYGDHVDVCAPGVDVVSYYLGGELYSMNGTSMATPHISAISAMLLSFMEDRTPAQIEKYIKDYCLDLGDPLYFGEGLPLVYYLAGE